MFLGPEQGGWTETEPSPSVRAVRAAHTPAAAAQSQGHIPLPGKRHFPIGFPSKEVCDVGRSAQALGRRVRNAGEMRTQCPSTAV